MTAPPPEVENEHEIAFRRPEGSRRGSLAGGLFLVLVVAVCFAVMRADRHPAAHSPSSYAFGIGGASAAAALLLLSGAGPNETVFNLDARTYRARRYRPLWSRRVSAPKTGIPFWGQTYAGPFDDIQGLMTCKEEGRAACFYYVCVTWKDGRRSPNYLAPGFCRRRRRSWGRGSPKLWA